MLHGSKYFKTLATHNKNNVPPPPPQMWGGPRALKLGRGVLVRGGFINHIRRLCSSIRCVGRAQAHNLMRCPIYISGLVHFRTCLSKFDLFSVFDIEVILIETHLLVNSGSSVSAVLLTSINPDHLSKSCWPQSPSCPCGPGS